ncbi:BTB POZ domain [Lecanosticta acicola]|uniref:BTB POZ domain n=1 Tax=Lecanosticta acicola TaxID=111012 RepID=A0AAI9EA29_9PEZI|nr:BTB POZ domain [Lecanosticta acicola]
MGDGTESITRNIGNLLLDGRFSDLKIICQGEEVKVHRAVVCNRSAVLAEECDGGFLDGEFRVIKHSLFDADTLKRLLHFLYRGSYTLKDADHNDSAESSPGIAASAQQTSQHQLATPQQPSSETTERSLSDSKTDGLPTAEEPESLGQAEAFVAHASVFEAASHYDIPELKASALANFKQERENLSSLTTDEFTTIAFIVYQKSVAPALRSEVLKIAIKHRHMLLHDDEFVKVMREEQELRLFATDFLRHFNKWHDLRIAQERRSFETESRQLREDKAAVSAELATVKSQLRAANSHLEMEKRQVTQLKALNEIESCRHCGFAFTYGLEGDGPGQHLARCFYCGTRHRMPF